MNTLLARRLVRSPALRAAIAVAACLFSHGGAIAALTSPTLNTPAASKSNWLFNLGTTGVRETFSWAAIGGATSYEFVLSKQSTFGNYYDATASCIASGCAAFSTTATSAGAGKFSGFVFEASTYYWKVRAVANGIRGPWSVTRSFTTTNRMNVVSKARSYSAAPQSRVDRTDGGTVTWLTELDVGYVGDNVDGKLLTNAYNIYGLAPAPRALGTTTSPTALRTKMRDALYRSGGWALAERDKLIDRIAATWVPTSLTRNGLLSVLGIRTQCKEFADRMVIAGGGTSKRYADMGTARLDVRPGMYVVWKSNAHAAIANAVIFDGNGLPAAQLSEANWGNIWKSNPVGQVPWQRTVQHTRPVSISTTGDYRAYEN